MGIAGLPYSKGEASWGTYGNLASKAPSAER